MNGGHDLGGKKGFGPINPEPEATESTFHYHWEERVFALTLACGMLGKWNLDESRHARERQKPADYLRNSYYENWLVGVEKLLVEKQLLNQQELESGSIDSRPEAVQNLRVPSAQDVKKILASGGPTSVDCSKAPRFKTGDRVRVRISSATGHTRAPAYAMGAMGIIEEHHGCHILPDENATGTRTGEHLYCVVFRGSVLWGKNEDGTEVAIDLWESYLQRVKETADD